MVEINIHANEIKKYIFLIVLFNAVFPRELEQSGMMINIADSECNVKKMAYEHFISTYDHYGLNQIAE